jgi:hypothetical protein
MLTLGRRLYHETIERMIATILQLRPDAVKIVLDNRTERATGDRWGNMLFGHRDSRKDGGGHRAASRVAELTGPRGRRVTSEASDLAPREYGSWLVYEVLFPSLMPALVFLILLIDFTIFPVADKGPREAMIAVAGTGDFLLIAALLLLNLSAKIQFVEGQAVSALVTKRSEREGQAALCAGIILLVVYAGFRIMFSTHESQNINLYEFIFGISSAIILTTVVVWSNMKVSNLHIRILEHKLHSGILRAQYNRP